jgi:hypothetical protein
MEVGVRVRIDGNLRIPLTYRNGDLVMIGEVVAIEDRSQEDTKNKNTLKRIFWAKKAALLMTQTI